MTKEQLFSQIKEFRANNPKLINGIEDYIGEILYNFIIENNIKTIVETGIYHGFSSWYFLEALKCTGGKLWSIESELQKEIVVPTELRSRWEIIKAASPEALYNLLSVLKSIDFFWHDSMHTFGIQFGEYAIAVEFAKFIGSHDVRRTGAWLAFLRLYGFKEILAGYKFGIVRNS